MDIDDVSLKYLGVVTSESQYYEQLDILAKQMNIIMTDRYNRGLDPERNFWVEIQGLERFNLDDVQPSYRFYGIYYHEDFIGYIQYQIQDVPNNGFDPDRIMSIMEISTLFIKEEYRGQGVGKAVLSDFIKKMEYRYWNCITIDLGAYNNDPIALNLYKSLGFEPYMTLMHRPINRS